MGLVEPCSLSPDPQAAVVTARLRVQAEPSEPAKAELCADHGQPADGSVCDPGLGV